MKQLNLTLLILAIFAVNVMGQDPTKAWKDAGKELNRYRMDSEKVESLSNAKTKIDESIAGIDQIAAKLHAKVYDRAGDIYFDIANNPNLKAKTPTAANVAMEYFTKTAEIGKDFQKEAVGKKLPDLGNVFVKDGQDLYEAKKYTDALDAFSNALACKDKIAELGNKASLFLITPEQENAIKLYAGFAAYNGKNYDAAKKFLEPVAAAEFDEAQIYSVLFKLYKEDDIDKAFSYLNAGVKRYPGEKALLYDKINYYLSTKQMDKLEADLMKAIEVDPTNAQLTFTLGQVYEDLSTDAYKAENFDDGDKYFASALDFYTKTVNIDAKYFDAIYQVGAIHYNRAVRMYKQRANLGMNEDAKYKELTEGINTMYTKAWESFKKAEQVRMNDELLITAMKELYARTNQTEHYTAFKERLEKVQADKEAQLAPYKHPASLF
jgi:tetratricopeptide (TPR) repeat protein